MSEGCTHNCESCGESCSERKKESFLKEPHSMSQIKKVIGIVSGKGGVGKSLVTALSAVISQRKDYRTAVLDADITGPSIPRMFGITDRALQGEMGMLPCVSKMGTEIMSLNLLTENDTDPVIWRGPVIAGVVTQFWTDVIWSDVDFMFIDMPPGTGDVPLTVFQSIPVDGIIVVASPQDLVSMIVEKAVKMAQMMNIEILGIVENMSYVECPDCKKQIKIFGDSHVDDIAQQNGLEVLGKIPVQPELASLCDNGCIESFKGDWLEKVGDLLDKLSAEDKD